jgi:hypothetical protein
MRRITVLLVTVGLTALAGCAVAGKWSLAAVEPEAARRDFEYASLTLQEDGSYYAESQTPGVKTMSGTYTYQNSTLTLMPHAGPRVAYHATFKDANHLRLTKTAGGQEVRTVFARVE